MAKSKVSDLLGMKDIFEERLKEAYNLTGSYRGAGRLLGVSKDTANKYLKQLAQSGSTNVPVRFQSQLANAKPDPKIAGKEIAKILERAEKETTGGKATLLKRLDLSPQQYAKIKKGSAYKNNTTIEKKIAEFSNKLSNKTAEPIKIEKGKKYTFRTYNLSDGNVIAKKSAEYQAIAKGKRNGKERTFTTSKFSSPEEAIAALSNLTKRKYRGDDIAYDDVLIKEIDSDPGNYQTY